jgi:hypothetical protein
MKRSSLFAALLMVSAAAQAGPTTFNVRQVFLEPDALAENTVFEGTFSLDSDTGTVSNLTGTLYQALTSTGEGEPPLYDMRQVSLTHQLSTVYDSFLGGAIVTVFRNPTVDTFAADSEGNTWAPSAGARRYFGYPGANPGNAYARIFIDVVDPTRPLTEDQKLYLAYADCSPGGMFGDYCMSASDLGGTLGGVPLSQTIIAAIPEPGTYASLLAGLGVLGCVGWRRGRSCLAQQSAQPA